MIGIARHTDYAARLILHLAALPPGTRVTIADIAARRLLPAPFVRRVLGRLVAAGMLATSRGLGGGVQLARPPHEISLLDVVNAMEGGLTLNRCVDAPGECPLSATCPVQGAWAEATQGLAAHLAAVTFDRLATRLRQAEGESAAPRPPRRRPPAAAGKR